ncbi:MAG: molybdopterin molybdotransferase MoeA [Alphaproteobacteria bacterium]|nr:molybdopterin molybdotransferase MoeA [Alphaproteobacteria bacterium]
MIPVAEAIARVLAEARPLPAEMVSLGDGLGRVLAEDLASRRTQPPTAVSAMDGYAVRAEDVARTPAELRIVGEIAAGAAWTGEVGQGEAARIFTGAPVPEGADAIVIQEDCERAGDLVSVREAAKAGAFVRPAGLDFAEGDVLLRAGRRLNSRDIGLAAAMNRPWLPVARRPRVALLATGDEIALPGEPLGPQQIVSSSGPGLAALVVEAGGVPVSLGVAEDSTASLRARAAGAEGADILVTMGGASVGEHDLVQEALASDGLEVDFWRIAMRPGKPLMFGRMGGSLVLGLPGNPVSAFVCALLFLRPLIDAMLGLPAGPPAREPARLGAELAANDRREDYLRARLAPDGEGLPVATPFARQDSSMLARFVEADALLVRAPHAPPASAGELVEIIRL